MPSGGCHSALSTGATVGLHREWVARHVGISFRSHQLPRSTSQPARVCGRGVGPAFPAETDAVSRATPGAVPVRIPDTSPRRRPAGAALTKGRAFGVAIFAPSPSSRLASGSIDRCRTRVVWVVRRVEFIGGARRCTWNSPAPVRAAVGDLAGFTCNIGGGRAQIRLPANGVGAWGRVDRDAVAVPRTRTPPDFIARRRHQLWSRRPRHTQPAVVGVSGNMPRRIPTSGQTC